MLLLRGALVAVLGCWLLACVAPREQLVREGPGCDSFAAFDARAREQLDALLAEAPGEALVRESSRLNASRRACARNTLGSLLERREREGLEAVQRELDALTQAYPQGELRALMADALGPDVASLEPLLQEAQVKVRRTADAPRLERRDDAERKKLEAPMPESMGAAPEVPDTLCDEPTPCGQLRCVASNEGASVEKPARRCLDAAASLAPLARAEQVAQVLALLPEGPSGVRTEALSALETLRRQLWPEVLRAAGGPGCAGAGAAGPPDRGVPADRGAPADLGGSAEHGVPPDRSSRPDCTGQPARAARLASPFRALPNVRAQVEALREAARAYHLARAKQLERSPSAAWLHRALAHELGADEPATLEAKGRWQPLRWRCKAEPLALPELPAGVEGTLSVKCGGEAPAEQPRTDSLRTFELESSMRSQRVEGSLSLTCAGKAQLFDVRVQEPGLEGFPEEALRQELQRLVERAVTECGRLHALAATRSCAELRRLTPAEVIERFVTHARFTQRWEPCFVEWLEASEGVSPPPVPSAPKP